ncbi:hypothetical protein LMG7974_01671 [Campylobacter majalis]|uniref:Motility accessory factor n=1 Tax=Campylobacter majalis TaxID=2790656 RepID=A0ABM8Q9R1_9BACT|nr:hypothetical protein [Campylobacter majalis]CAD7289594.1 hypothetical protein LMG7974_01671 [Campylobacter majalis]
MAFDFSEFGDIENLAKIGVQKLLNDNLQTAMKLHETQNAINKILNQIDEVKRTNL